MYQGNGSNGIVKQRVRHQHFYFIVRISSNDQLIPLSILLCFLNEYTWLNRNFFTLYQEIKLITHFQKLKHITYHQDLQNTTHCYHPIPYNHIRLTKSLWNYKNNLTLKLLLNSLTPQNPLTTIHVTIEVGQLHRQLIILVLIIIIRGLLKIYGIQ